MRLWDTVTCTETARLQGHIAQISVLVALPDGRLASGAWDNMVRLWDSATGVEIGRLEGHTGPVCALAVLPVGRLASGSWDRMVRLWDPPLASSPHA